MVRHITYTNDLMTISAELCGTSALKYGCDISTIYTEEKLFKSFIERNKEVLSHKKGAGYFIWKPQVILQEFFKSNEGDVILYTDAGIEIIKSVMALTNQCENIILFGGLWDQRDWCKGGLGMDYKQLNAAAMVFKVCEKSFKFLNKWNLLCQKPGRIDDSPFGINAETFQEHRWDQALLTIVQHNEGIEPYWMPSQVNGHINPKNYKGEYPVIFNHHRKRNSEWTT